MEPFTRMTGRAAPLGLANIDTDQIIPAHFLKTIERKGLAKGLFLRLRFNIDGSTRPDFVLNQPAYEKTSILVTGENFGCGSSREHAPWALLDYGIRCIIAPSFADIFFNNAANNGLLLIRLPENEVAAIMQEAKGGNHVFSIDLEAQEVVAPSGVHHRFDIERARKIKLLRGLDAIDETMQYLDDIDAFERRRLEDAPLQG